MNGFARPGGIEVVIGPVLKVLEMQPRQVFPTTANLINPRSGCHTRLGVLEASYEGRRISQVYGPRRQPKSSARLVEAVHPPAIIPNSEIHRRKNRLRKRLAHEAREEDLSDLPAHRSLKPPREDTNDLLLDSASTLPTAGCHPPPERTGNSAHIKPWMPPVTPILTRH